MSMFQYVYGSVYVRFSRCAVQYVCSSVLCGSVCVRFSVCTFQYVCCSLCLRFSICTVQYVCGSLCVRFSGLLFSMCAVQYVCGSLNGSVTIAVTKEHYALHCRYPPMHISLPLPHDGTQHAVCSKFKPTEYLAYVAHTVQLIYTEFSSHSSFLFVCFLDSYNKYSLFPCRIT